VSMLVLQSTNFLCRYRSVVLRPDEDIVIVISQSGETADTLAALRHTLTHTLSISLSHTNKHPLSLSLTHTHLTHPAGCVPAGFLVCEHAGLLINESLCRYRSVVLRPDEDIVIVISQSGETADTLAALRHAKEAGCLVLGIVNTVCQLPNSAHISQSCPESGYDFQAKHRPSKVFRLLHSHTHPHPLNSLTHKRTQTPRRPAASSSASSTR